MRADATEGDIFATANDGLRSGQGSELAAQCKCALQRNRKTAKPIPLRKELSRFLGVVRRCIARDLSLDERKFNAANSCRLTGAEDSLLRSLLFIIHANKSGAKVAAKQRSKLRVGDKMKSAGEQTARLFPNLVSSTQRDALQLAVAFSGDWPAARVKRNASKLSLELKELRGLLTMSSDAEPKANQATPRGLLGNDANISAVLAQERSHGNKQGTGPRHNDSLPCDTESGFGKSLQPACANDVGERPPGEWEKVLARARAQNQLFVLQLELSTRRLCEKGASNRIVNHLGRRNYSDRRGFEPLKPTIFDWRAGVISSPAPDLAAGARVVVDETYAGAALGGTARRRNSRRPRADDNNIETPAQVNHRSGYPFLARIRLGNLGSNAGR
jgi:hypothetical protein